MIGLGMTGEIKPSFNRDEYNSIAEMGKWWYFFGFFSRFPIRYEFPLAFRMGKDLADCTYLFLATIWISLSSTLASFPLSCCSIRE